VLLPRSCQAMLFSRGNHAVKKNSGHLGLLAAASFAIAAVAGAGSALGGPRNDDPAERRLIAYSANLPACHDGAVVSEITSEFARRESEFWNSSLAITAIDRVSEGGLRPWGRDFIPRRFCTARILLNNQKFATVSYSVREGLGLIGWTWDVNWCVTGIDRHKAYAPACLMARP
jgi:hypothetical protein